MRDRLIELLGSFPTFVERTLADKWKPEAVERLADHLLAAGVIVPPCKVGQTVWRICRNPMSFEYEILEQGVWYIHMYEHGLHIYLSPLVSFRTSAIGKTLFLTREEAEKALKERSKA